MEEIKCILLLEINTIYHKYQIYSKSQLETRNRREREELWMESNKIFQRVIGQGQGMGCWVTLARIIEEVPFEVTNLY